MKAVEFKEQNMVYAKEQKEYHPLPVHKTITGIATSCWSLDIRERIRVLFKGNIYLSQMTFNKPLQPISISTEFTDHGIPQ
jgi:hypothetical protein